MSKYTIKLETIEESIQNLNIEAKTIEENQVIENIKEKIVSLLNQDNEIVFKNKEQIHELICDEIDEEIKKHTELSKEFLEKLEDIRIGEYLKLVFSQNKKIHNGYISGDNFLHENKKRIDNAGELLGVDTSNMFTTEYFNNYDNVFADLEKFASFTETNNIIDLSLNNPLKNPQIVTNNGITISWYLYLSTASNCLLKTPKISPRNGTIKLLLDTISNKKGVDEDYIKDRTNLLYDLNNYSKYTASKKINFLSPSNPQGNKIITLRNGKKVRWDLYLYAIGKHLIDTSLNSGYRGYGYEKFFESLTLTEKISKEYFLNIDNILNDLKEFTKVANKNKIELLSTINPSGREKVYINNGQYISWHIYLTEVSNVLLGTDDKDRENLPKKGQALSKLFEIIGIEREIDKTRKRSEQLQELLNNKESQNYKELEKIFMLTGSYSLLTKFVNDKYSDLFESEYETQLTLKEILKQDKIGTVNRNKQLNKDNYLGLFQDIGDLINNDYIYDFFKERYIKFLFPIFEKNDLVFYTKVKQEVEKIPQNKSDGSENLVKTLLSEVLGYFNSLLNVEVSSKFKTVIKDDNFKTRKFPSMIQKEAVQKIVMYDRILVAEGTGAGKTAISMLAREQKELCDKFNGKAPITLVVCPAQAIKNVWLKRFEKYYKSENMPTYQVLSKNTLQSEDFELKDYNIISYNNLSSCLKLLKELDIEYLIIDEVQNIKNSDGKWNNCIDEIIQSYEDKLSKREKNENNSPQKLQLMKLSATPFTNHLTKDINYILKLLGLLDDGVKGIKGLLKTDPSAIRDMLNSVLLRHNRDDILVDLPKNTDKKLEKDLGTYENILYDFVFSLKDFFHPMKILNYLQLLSINPKYVASLVEADIKKLREVEQSEEINQLLNEIQEVKNLEFEETKLNLLKSIIDEKIDDGEKKILIFTSNITEGILKSEKNIKRLKDITIREMFNLDEDSKIDKETREKAYRLLEEGELSIKQEHVEEEIVYGKIKSYYESKGFDVIFIDQNISMEDREYILETEKNNQKKKTILFLTGATSGEAIDTSFAHTSIKLNPAWTEAEEEQIIGRSHRPGQKHESEYIRLLVGELDKAISIYAKWKDEKIKKLIEDGEAINEEDLTAILSIDKTKTIERFIKDINRQEYEGTKVLIDQLLIYKEELLDLSKWQNAINKSNGFHKTVGGKNIINWYENIEKNKSYSSDKVQINPFFIERMEIYKQDPNHVIKKMVEFIARDLLEKKLKNRLNELYEMDKNYGNMKVSVKMASDFDDAYIKSKIDLIVVYEDTNNSLNNKYVGFDVVISKGNEYLYEKSNLKISNPKEFNLSHGLSSDFGISRKILHFKPEFFAHFMYDYMKQIELTGNSNVIDIFKNVFCEDGFHDEINKSIDDIIEEICVLN